MGSVVFTIMSVSLLVAHRPFSREVFDLRFPLARPVSLIQILTNTDFNQSVKRLDAACFLCSKMT